MIGLFAHSIEQLVALATLMPIVASVAGNTGNQTVALFVRGLAMDQINSGNIRYLSFKEAAVSSINGLVWGSVYRPGRIRALRQPRRSVSCWRRPC